MTRMSSIPAATASSTTYWMAGLSRTGSISLGWALVAGRKRVPRPAAGITALRTAEVTGACLCSWFARSCGCGSVLVDVGVDDSILAGRLGGIQRLVGRAHQLLDRGAVVRVAGHPGRERDRQGT